MQHRSDREPEELSSDTSEDIVGDVAGKLDEVIRTTRVSLRISQQLTAQVAELRAAIERMRSEEPIAFPRIDGDRNG